jgi:hypothetical protein
MYRGDKSGPSLAFLWLFFAGYGDFFDIKGPQCKVRAYATYQHNAFPFLAYAVRVVVDISV